MSSSTDRDPMIGVAIGRYVIRRKLAEGGMGAVFLAEHEHESLAARRILAQRAHPPALPARGDSGLAPEASQHRHQSRDAASLATQPQSKRRPSVCGPPRSSICRVSFATNGGTARDAASDSADARCRLPDRRSASSRPSLEAEAPRQRVRRDPSAPSRTPLRGWPDVPPR